MNRTCRAANFDLATLSLLPTISQHPAPWSYLAGTDSRASLLKLQGSHKWCQRLVSFPRMQIRSFGFRKFQMGLLTWTTNDHNIIGTLQLVAKALEIWFLIAAGESRL